MSPRATEPQAAAASNPGASNAFLRLLGRHKRPLDLQLSKRLQEAARRHAPEGTEVSAMLEAAEALTLRGGKRLRAGLILVGSSLGEGSSRLQSRVLQAGCAVELLQSYFLIHDDWMDQDELRRGGPSVHAALGQRFKSTHLGACGAILAGDYYVALASAAFNRAIKAHPRAFDLMSTFTELQLQAVVGQQLDVIGKTRDAERIYELKTSSYTVAGPLRLGALLADADTKTLKLVERFSQPVGIAFQLQDDLLSLFGDPRLTGKPLGNDLKAGKWTWLVQDALERSHGDARKKIERVLGNNGATVAQLKTASAAIESCGARSASRQRISELRAKAERIIQRSALSTQQKDILLSASSALIERSQ